MDIPSARGKTNHWQNPQDKSQKSNIISSQDIQLYNNNSNNNSPLKRTLSGSDQRRSSCKKRRYTQQISPTVPTDEDEDDDEEEEEDLDATADLSKPNNELKDDDRRRAAHTAAEQKRRNAIRKGYDSLQSLVPNSHLLDPISSQKVSKAAILKRSTDYLVQLNKEKQQLTKQLQVRKNEVYCLRAVQKTYADILETNINSNKHASASIDDEQKFQVFRNLSDAMFGSFDQALQAGQTTDFSVFTSAVLRWVEDSCRPTDINEIIRRVLGQPK